MRKMLFTPFIVCVVALLCTASIPAAHACGRVAPHINGFIKASGEWTYEVTIIDQRSVDGYTFIYATEESIWTGTFTGTSHDVFTVVIFPSGRWYAWGLVFYDGTVDGKSGTLVMYFAGWLNEEWLGRSVILSGTGDLAKLCGQLTWWGPSYNLDYSGKIHFN